MSEENRSILVLGGGNFGTCLAQHLATRGHLVTIWSREKDVVASINKSHKNPKYLSSFSLSKRISATNQLSADLLKNSDALLLAVPTRALRSVLGQIKPFVEARHILVNAAKGIELERLHLPLGIVSDVLGPSFGNAAVVVSGPSFAAEVIECQPTAVSCASLNDERAVLVQEIFHAPHFRVYTSNDPVGVEVAGALKNVIAIAAGACSGLGFQRNAQAALLTRGLAEITRVGVALGAQPLTFVGLGGVGDLFLTCTSEKSRNYTVGYRLGQGDSLDAAQQAAGSVAEGVFTAESYKQIIDKLGVIAPIGEEVYKVIYAKKPIRDAVTDLMTREPKAELA